MFNNTIDGVLFCQSLSLRLNPQGPEANKLFVNSAEVQNQWGLHSTVATCIKYTVHYACWKELKMVTKSCSREAFATDKWKNSVHINYFLKD